ncbi:MAG: glycosyltransferase [Endozoicomonas sp. (ex Botrylloides leachii)]|nr:glycosyltransferase [Endozoicomonas sp. (ex Botrylloides leachii)]
MKIIAIAQFYNELESGFLEQFCRYNAGLFDAVICYDDGSTDGTGDFCRSNGFYVIRGAQNDFKSEVLHKSLLISKAGDLGAEFIVPLDADEILVASRPQLEGFCETVLLHGCDGLYANFINLWRSNSYKRTDSLFDDLKPVKLWRHNPKTPPFQRIERGLHKRMYPDYVENARFEEEFVILHTGFSTKERILEKFIRYRNLGQSGFQLMRFIDESRLSLEKVPERFLPLEWNSNDIKPIPLKVREYFNDIEIVKARVFRPKITIFSLVYKDIGWLEFLYQQFLAATPIKDVEFYFVANDADDSVISYLTERYIPFYNFRNQEAHLTEHYINNVYRAYNFGVSKAQGDYVVLLNSDMAFSEGWLEALLNYCEEGVCVASRLIEPGKLKTGKHGIERNFGASWNCFDEESFRSYANSIRDDRTEDGGLYMPLMIRKKDFDAVGGYPEGNIIPESDPWNPVIAEPGVPVVSGDTAFIQKLASIGVKHITAFNSVVYHFQEGEKRSQENTSDIQIHNDIVISNNQIQGINGEKVLWGHLLDMPNTLALDYGIVGGKTPESFQAYAKHNRLSSVIVLQNATFIPRLFVEKYTLMYLQDNLRAMEAVSAQQEANLRDADCWVTNTIDTAASYPEYDFDICPVGIDSDLFFPVSKQVVRSKHGIGANETVGIFVGALDDVKGWPEVLNIINLEPELTWIVVTKYDDQLVHPRIRFFSKQPQTVLAELLNCSDFFILGSPVETQCLAAIEAALCDVPVVIKSVGIFSSFSHEERSAVGSIQEDLHLGVKDVLANQERFSPRRTLMSKGISLETTKMLWWKLFAREKMKALSDYYKGVVKINKQPPLLKRMTYLLEVFYRFRILKPLINRDTFYSVAEISVFVRDKMPKPVHRFLRYLWRLYQGSN